MKNLIKKGISHIVIVPLFIALSFWFFLFGIKIFQPEFNTSYTAFAESTAVFNVKDYGAKGDGATEDQQAFKNALAAIVQNGGGKLYIPAGTYIMAPPADPAKNSVIEIKRVNNIEFYGDGQDSSIIKLKPGVDYSAMDDTHIFQVIDSSNLKFHDMGFDGSFTQITTNKAKNEQMHHIFLLNARNVLIEKVRFAEAFGDGVYMVNSQRSSNCQVPYCYTEDITIRNSTFFHNNRSGIAVQRGTKRLNFLDNYFEAISDQSIDFEPTGNKDAPVDVVITGNTIKHSTKTDALTLWGDSGADPGRNFTIKNNVIDGGSVLIGRVDGLVFENNKIVNLTNRWALGVLRYSRNVIIKNNYIENSLSNNAIQFSDSETSGIKLISNTIIQKKDGGNGVVVENAGNNIHLLNNKIIGSGSTTKGIGIYFNNQADDGLTRVDYKAFENQLYQFMTAIRVSTNLALTPFDGVKITDNKAFSSQAPAGELPIVFSPKDTSTYITNLTVSGNTIEAYIEGEAKNLLRVKAKGSTGADGLPTQLDIRVKGQYVIDRQGARLPPTELTADYKDYLFKVEGLGFNSQVDLIFLNATEGRAMDVDRIHLDMRYTTGGEKIIQAEDPAVKFDRGSGEAAYDGIDVVAGTEHMDVNGALRFNLF